MFTLFAVYLAGGAVLAALSIPLILQMVGPNPIYGFRVSKTLNDPSVWYAANRYTGKRLLAVGIGFLVTATLLYFIPGMDVDTYALACLGVFVVLFGWALVQSWRYMASL
jgi:hypothetical protein